MIQLTQSALMPTQVGRLATNHIKDNQINP